MNSVVMDIINDDYIDDEEKLEIEHLQEFKEEALEILETLEEYLISLDNEKIDDEIIKKIFRAFHSVKGIAGFASQSLVEVIAHNTENVLTKLQNRIIDYDSIILEILINSVELIKQICNDFALAKDKKLNEIVKIHLNNMKNVNMKKYKKIAILEDHIFQNEDFVKIPTHKIEDFYVTLNTIRDLNNSFSSENLEKCREDINAQINKIEEYVYKFKNQEMNYLFKKLRKIINYTAKTSGVDCEFLSEGGDILVEKKIINKLFVPLSQIIRNAITHGLLNKEGEKYIRIRAYKENDILVILVENNGEEINKIKISNKLKEQKIKFYDENILNAIFLSGFSTKAKKDMISGRGIGLDIVKSEIEKMKGNISVFSENGKGTTFKIILPAKENKDFYIET